MITSAKLKNIVSKKSLGNNTISAQLYQMFFLNVSWKESLLVDIRII